MPITNITVSKASPSMEDYFDIEVVDSDAPSHVVLEAEVLDLEGAPKYRSFVLKARAGSTTVFYKTIHGWELGQFAAQDVTWRAYSDFPNKFVKLITMECRGTDNPFSSVVQYIINLLKNDLTLSTFVKPDQIKRVRKPKQYRTQTPAYYVYTQSSTHHGRQGTAKIAYEDVVMVEFLQPITGQREVDLNKHEVFIHRLSELIANNTQLDPALGVSVSFPRRGNIPHNTFSYQFTIVSTLEIFVRITPDYPAPVIP